MNLVPLLAMLLAAPDRPLPELPYTPGLDLAAMDRKVDPCVDFYGFACGGWQKRNPIPADQASWSVYAKLANDNQQFLWGLLDAAARPAEGRSPEEKQVGDFFAACMDEKAIEAAGREPIAADLAAIEALTSVEELPALLGRLHRFADGRMMFGLGAEQSFEDSSQVVAWVMGGGLGLPDRDQYLTDDKRAKEVRAAYQAHVQRSLALSGMDRKASAAGAATVMRIETELAKATLTRVEKRDPTKLWHRTPVAELAKATPHFKWKAYTTALGAPDAEWVNVTEPAFFAALDGLLEKEPLAAWKTYLRWHLVRSASPYLSSAFQKESFGFYQAKLRGTKQLAPRWKRCVRWVDGYLGEALGKVFVDRAFPPAVKADAEKMVRLIQDAMDRRLDTLAWMDPATRAAAKEKLRTMRNKIGYPAKWRDYSSLKVDRADFAGNIQRGAAFDTAYQLAKIGKPVNRDEWGMTPPTVNAYYNPLLNDINFPAGVLLPPLWDPKMDLAPGYGNTGGTVGHELIHGFDDEGRQFDAKGNLKDWWTPADDAKFKQKAQCILDQYAGYTVVDDIKINSKLTLGEDIADLAGVILAYEAWKDATRGETLEPRDGLTPAQRFFVGFAQWDCANTRPEDQRVRALTDPHSPPRWRINGVVVNMPEFAEAFQCKAGQPMVKKDVCTIW